METDQLGLKLAQHEEIKYIERQMVLSMYTKVWCTYQLEQLEAVADFWFGLIFLKYPHSVPIKGHSRPLTNDDAPKWYENHRYHLKHIEIIRANDSVTFHEKEQLCPTSWTKTVPPPTNIEPRYNNNQKQTNTKRKQRGTASSSAPKWPMGSESSDGNTLRPSNSTRGSETTQIEITNYSRESEDTLEGYGEFLVSWF